MGTAMTSTPFARPKRPLAGGLLCSLLLAWPLASVASEVTYVGPAPTGQQGPQGDPVPPNIVFLVDASSSMAGCLTGERIDRDGNGTLETCRLTRLNAVKRALEEVADSLTDGWLALAQTDPSDLYAGLGTRPTFAAQLTAITRPGIISPLGASRARFKGALASLTLNTRDAPPFTEALRDIWYYYSQGVRHCNDLNLCTTSPIRYECQTNHIVVLTDGTSALAGIDASPIAEWIEQSYNISPDITTTNNRSMDDIAGAMAYRDLMTSLDGSQTVSTWVLGMDITSVSDRALFDSVAYHAGTAYINTTSYDGLRSALYSMLNRIVAGTYQKAPPVLTIEGSKMLVGWHEASSGRPLYMGHLNGYELDVDPESSTYGEPLSGPNSPWEGGASLEARDVFPAESRLATDGNNGEGTRDIFTNIDQDEEPDAFDASNVDDLCPLLLNNAAPTSSGWTSPGVMEMHDINLDRVVDVDDCQMLIDFIRGDSTADYRIGTGARGPWKLGSIRHSQPAVVVPRPQVFSRNVSLRTFIESLPEQLVHCPDPDPTEGDANCEARVVFVTADDGMIHAFNAFNGDELWAYIPRNMLGRTTSASIEKGELLDLMWGQRDMVDATPRVGFVWIDGYMGAGQMGTPDEVQTADEWARVLIVGEGEGGRYWVALDVTQPDDPYILWEDTAGSSTLSRMGATTGTPALALIRDDGVDRWAAIYGSGREIDNQALDARLYLRWLGDLQGAGETFPDEGFPVTVDLDGNSAHDGIGLPSDPLVVDSDFDGDADDVFVATTNGVLYRYALDENDINDTEACRFFDPQNADLDNGEEDQVEGQRAAAQWGPTAALSSSGQLLVYFGTGSSWEPFSTTAGAFYVLRASPGCTEAALFTDCSDDGVVALGSGERLMGSPVVYGGAVFFTTYAPAANRCDEGEARLYGIDAESCTAVFDTNNNGAMDGGDDLFYTMGRGQPSAPVVANGSIYIATTVPADDNGDEPLVQRFELPELDLRSSAAIQWREPF